MHSLQKQFHDFISAHQMIGKNEKVVLAVSGGLDSMVMCHLFQKTDLEFAIAHCNFGLRGEESDGDEAFVMEWAHTNNINCFVKSFDLGENSIQLEARNARYNWFYELLDEYGFNKIATAHQLNDSLETLLFNLSRGTGFKGISGVPTIAGNVIRPLLFASRKSLMAFAMDERIEWREDSSNQKDDYNRNYIRHHIVPEMEKLNASLLKSFLLTNERLRYGADVIEEKVNEIKEEHFRKEGHGGYQLSLEWIKEEKDLVILSEILSSFHVNYSTCKEIYHCLGKPGKSFPTEKWFITMDRDFLFIDEKESQQVEMRIDKVGSYDLGKDVLRFELIEKKEVTFESESVGYFDADQLGFPVVIRPWRDGDRFQPLGMKSSKKVSDLLVDLKVPVRDKKNVYVIESNERIAWVVNHRISDLFKITDETTRVLKVSKC